MCGRLEVVLEEVELPSSPQTGLRQCLPTKVPRSLWTNRTSKDETHATGTRKRRARGALPEFEFGPLLPYKVELR